MFEVVRRDRKGQSATKVTDTVVAGYAAFDEANREAHRLAQVRLDELCHEFPRRTFYVPTGPHLTDNGRYSVFRTNGYWLHQFVAQAVGTPPADPS